MNKEDLLKLVEDNADISKAEIISIVVGLITTGVALSKEAKESKDKVLLGLVLAIVLVQSIVLLVLIIWLMSNWKVHFFGIEH